MELFRCREDAAGHWAYEGAGADSKAKPSKEPGEQRGAVTGRQQEPPPALGWRGLHIEMGRDLR